LICSFISGGDFIGEERLLVKGSYSEVAFKTPSCMESTIQSIVITGIFCWMAVSYFFYKCKHISIKRILSFRG